MKLFIMDSMCEVLSSREGLGQWDTHSLTYSLIQAFSKSPLYAMVCAGYRCYTGHSPDECPALIELTASNGDK